MLSFHHRKTLFTASYLNGTDDEYWNVKAPVKNCSYEAIVNLLKGNAQPGDLICLRNSKVDQTYGHIMFVGSVRRACRIV